MSPLSHCLRLASSSRSLASPGQGCRKQRTRLGHTQPASLATSEPGRKPFRPSPGSVASAPLALLSGPGGWGVPLLAGATTRGRLASSGGRSSPAGLLPGAAGVPLAPAPAAAPAVTSPKSVEALATGPGRVREPFQSPEALHFLMYLSSSSVASTAGTVALKPTSTARRSWGSSAVSIDFALEGSSLCFATKRAVRRISGDRPMAPATAFATTGLGLAMPGRIGTWTPAPFNPGIASPFAFGS
mmetsp:Transcript_60367/g.167138  ORF Transcript_60367/g.167138 Transcript_60367/m.167138 type:complete len:244 (+) Transcript_60367:408-1139(+)